MNILETFIQLRDDLKSWVTNNLNALNAKIDEKTIPIDNELSSTSTNPVQNKAITNAINNIPIFSGDYNDLINAPDISEDESGNMVIADESGNIIFKADADGIHTTALTLNGESVEDIVDERVASLVDSAPDTLNTLNELAAALGDDPNFATTIATEIGKKVDKVDGKGLSTNDFTDAHKNKLDSIDLENITFEESDPTVPAWAKAENKPTYTADEVNALPDTTVLADLSDDTEHRTVTDAEKAVWNAKSDFSGDYNDLENAPNITEDESNNLVIADPDGNVIFRSDGNGFETTTLTAQSIVLNGMDVESTINGLDADDFGIYVQAQEPTEAVAGDIWIDTANDPSYIPPAIPEITEADNGKVLMVVNGKLQLVNLNLTIDANGVVSM